MTKFDVHTIETAPEGSRDALAATAKAWGFVPKLQGVLAESPVALKAYETLFGLVGESSLTPVERQVVFLTVSVFHGCEYCTMGHTYLARQAKLDEASIAALRAGGAPGGARFGALGRFARGLAETRGFVGDGAVDAFIAAGFTKANVLEVVTVVAAKTISNYTNHITHTPNEEFMSDPSLAWSAPRSTVA